MGKSMCCTSVSPEVKCSLVLIWFKSTPCTQEVCPILRRWKDLYLRGKATATNHSKVLIPKQTNTVLGYVGYCIWEHAVAKRASLQSGSSGFLSSWYDLSICSHHCKAITKRGLSAEAQTAGPNQNCQLNKPFFFTLMCGALPTAD